MTGIVRFVGRVILAALALAFTLWLMVLAGLTLDLALLWQAFLPAVTFSLLFGLRVRWWESEEGRHLLVLTVLLTLLIARSVSLRIDAAPEVPASWYLRALVFVIALLLWQRLWLLVKYQWLNRDDR